MVPDEKAAVKVALAILEPIYGKKTLDGEQPFKAKLTKGVWHVEGSLPEGWLGGVAEIEFRKSDCQVLKIIHGK